jgi:hypothetical protein
VFDKTFCSYKFQPDFVELGSQKKFFSFVFIFSFLCFAFFFSFFFLLFSFFCELGSMKEEE